MGSTDTWNFGLANTALWEESSPAPEQRNQKRTALGDLEGTISQEPRVQPSSPTTALQITTKMSTLEDFNIVYPARTPFRSQSQLHIRDIRDQMHGIKSKISSLTAKAPEDPMRRRSLQSTDGPGVLATPGQSSTTMAEADGYDLYSTSIVKNQLATECKALQTASPLKRREHYIVDITCESQLSNQPYGDFWGSSTLLIPTDKLPRPPETACPVEEEYRQPFPIPPLHETLRHEDRLDAFDYENFVLHSALGSRLSESRRRSYSSVGSNETTRPAGHIAVDGTAGCRSRANSFDSVSTVATFATATEGFDSADHEEYSERGLNDMSRWQKNENDMESITSKS